MQIMIDIPEEYKDLFETERCKSKFDSLATNEFDYVLRKAFENGAPLLKDNKCKWIHCDYRTIYPKEHDITFWMIPENRMDALKHCSYCGKEIEIEAEK